jgi:hypothetical protein
MFKKLQMPFAAMTHLAEGLQNTAQAECRTFSLFSLNAQENLQCP